jgi:hypothetical protein
MTDLVITSGRSALPISTKSIIENASQSPLAKYNNPDGRSEIMSLIGTTLSFQHTINGVRTNDNLTPEEITMQKGAILSVVFRYGFLTKKELEFIFSRGMVGEYGERDIFFNARSVNLWIRKYIEEHRKQALAANARSLQDDFTPPEPTDEEKSESAKAAWKRLIEYAEKCHNQAKEILLEGSFKPEALPPITGSEYYYRKLIEKGLLEEPTKERKLEVMNKHKLQAIDELQKRDGRHIDTSNPEIVTVCKRLAMAYFVKELLSVWFLQDEDFRTML